MLGSHPSHAAARASIRARRVGLAGHAWFETFSVLTRLPPPQRGAPEAISQALHQNFPETCWLSEAAARDLATRCAALGIAGGAIYDALVGATALANELPLLTGDQRALATYGALGIDARIVF